jgi:hypothetical protein
MEGSRKKPRLDDGAEPFFKGTFVVFLMLYTLISLQCRVCRFRETTTNGNEAKKRPRIPGASPKLGGNGWKSTDGTRTSNEVCARPPPLTYLTRI